MPATAAAVANEDVSAGCDGVRATEDAAMRTLLRPDAAGRWGANATRTTPDRDPASAKASRVSSKHGEHGYEC